MAESVARPTAFRLERGSNLTPLRGSKAYPALMDTGPRLGPNLREGRKWPHYLLIPLGQDVGCATCLKVTLTKRTPTLLGLVKSRCLAPLIPVFSKTNGCWPCESPCFESTHSNVYEASLTSHPKASRRGFHSTSCNYRLRRPRVTLKPEAWWLTRRDLSPTTRPSAARQIPSKTTQSFMLMEPPC